MTMRCKKLYMSACVYLKRSDVGGLWVVSRSLIEAHRGRHILKMRAVVCVFWAHTHLCTVPSPEDKQIEFTLCTTYTLHTHSTIAFTQTFRVFCANLLTQYAADMAVMCMCVCASARDLYENNVCRRYL